jgi:hypothetical protein
MEIRWSEPRKCILTGTPHTKTACGSCRRALRNVPLELQHVSRTSRMEQKSSSCYTLPIYGTYHMDMVRTLSIALSSERDSRQHFVGDCRNRAKGLSPALYKWGLFLYTSYLHLTHQLPPTFSTVCPNQTRPLHQLHPLVFPIRTSRRASRDAIALRLCSLAGVGRVLRLRLQHRWQWVQHHVCWLSAPHARCCPADDGYRRAVYPSADQ